MDYNEEELIEAINKSKNTNIKSSVKHVSMGVGHF